MATATVTKTGAGAGTVSGPGIDCGLDCSHTFNRGAVVTLTATPDASSTFSGWSGACTGTGVCTVTMSQARTVTAAFATVILTACENTGWPGTPYEGYGAGAVGGAGSTGAEVVHITSLADSGAGTLRAAIDQSLTSAWIRRCVVFDVAGNIPLLSPINVRGAKLTIDGFSAPAPGITLTMANGAAGFTNYMLIYGSGDNDTIIRGLRCDGGLATNGLAEPNDQGSTCLALSNGMTPAVVDHVSFRNTGDDTINCDSLSIAGVRATISWSIFSKRGTTLHPTGSILNCQFLSVHHNLWDTMSHRVPIPGYPAGITDFRNNLLWDRYNRGIQPTNGVTANVVNNYFHHRATCESDQTCRRRAIVRCGSGLAEDASANGCTGSSGAVHVSGNVMSGLDSAYINTKGTLGSPISVPAVTTTDACSAAQAVRATAGVRGAGLSLDAFDTAIIAAIPSSLPGC